MTTGSNTHSHQVTIAGKTYSTNAKAHTHAETPDPDAPVITAETNARIAGDTNLAGLITSLTARVAALEVPPVVPPPVIPPPVVVPPPTGPTITAGPTATPSDTGASITWTLSEPCTGQVQYGLTTTYGSLSALEASFTYTTHVQSLTGLTAGTTYHYRVTSKDSAGLTVISADQTFVTTGAVVVPPPVITPVPPPYDQAPPSATLLAWTGQDQSAAYAALVAPNKQIALEPNKTYIMNNRTQIQGVHGWDLFAQGSQVMSQGYYTGTTPDSWFRVIACQNWRMRDLEVIGPATLADVTNCYANYGYSRENWRGIIVEGGHNMNMDRVKAHGYWGDPLYIGKRDNLVDPYASPDGLTMTDCDFHTAGRNPVSLVAGSNITSIRGSRGNGGLSAWDTEPNALADATHFVTFTGVHFYGGNIGKAGAASHDLLNNSYSVYVSAGQAPAYDVVFDGCTFDVGAIYCRGRNGRNQNITIKNCSATTVGQATFEFTDGVVFTNNININRVDM